MKEFTEKPEPKNHLLKIAAFSFGIAVGSSYLTHFSPENSAMVYLYGWTTGAAFCVALVAVIGCIARLK